MEYTNSMIRELIKEHVHNQRNRRLLYRRLVDGLTFEELSGEFSLSVRQVKTIVYREQEILFRHVPK